MKIARFLAVALLAGLAWPVAGRAEEAKFLRGINLGGPAVTIDGQAWEGSEAKSFQASGKTFENQQVTLKPTTDGERARMIRSSVWGDKVDVELREVPAGAVQVFLYVWEDNNNERFNVLVNDQVVVEAFESGAAGMWKKLGPFPAHSVDGKLKISARAASHGAANLSGIEIWSGDGSIPMPRAPEFAAVPSAEQTEFFEKHIRPVLVDNCYECHSANAKKIKGGLVLDSRAGVQKGGENGAVIKPGDLDASALIEAVRHLDEDTAMPPKKKLPPEAIAALEQWVKMGAPDPRATDTVAAVQTKSAIDWVKARKWWSFRPLTAPPVPAVKDMAWPANDVDRFTLARMEAAGLAPAVDAEPRALIRRVTYDLTGLPPTPEEVEAFVAQSAKPAAYAQLIDRLLASPRYGERWGRHWLDVVRYADTAGDNSDFPIPQMHKYRDWVIAAFNRDLPYDQFVREQLAGDLLGGEGEERLQRIVATGYIANARRFGSRVDDYPQHLTIEDTLDSVGRTFLGLTINCARCHDHKFDPITAQDYYALYGIFSSTRYPWPGIELEQKQRDFIPLVAPEKLADVEAAKKERDAEQSRLDKDVQKLKDEAKNVAEDQKKAHEEKVKAAEKLAAEHKSKPMPFETAYAVAEGAKRDDAVLQQKGDPARPGDKVPRRFLTVLGGAALSAEEKGSGRRQLADWILAADNPLPARVMANRIWHYHFGRGLVPTPNDFGKQGKPPTHPELLDYLAAKLRNDGWSIKALHREILLSRTYRLASKRSPDALTKDPTNELLTAFPRQRLDAESLRDTLLALGGNLDLTPAGAHPFPKPGEWKFTQHNPFKAIYDSPRRSVFLMTQRIQRHPFLAIFDGADPSTSTPARPTSTTPVQSLFFLNDPLVHEQSKRVAARIVAEASDEPTRVQLAYALLFARAATPTELTAGQAFLASSHAKNNDEQEAWRSYLRTLFRLNEFVYLD